MRIVDRESFVHDLALRPRDVDDGLGELVEGELVRVPDVDGEMLPRLGQQHQASHEVVDVTEASSLRSVSEDGERLVRKGLTDEGRDRPAVVGPHPRAVGVEDSDDARVHALLAVVGHGQRLCITLRLVVHAARADRVDIAPVALRLRMHLWVPVDLARRGEQVAGALELREPQRVVCPV